MAWPDCPRCGGAIEGAAECPHCGVDPSRYRAYLDAIAVPPPLPPAPPPPPVGAAAGGLWLRAGAFAIDYAIVLLAQGAWSLAARLVWGPNVQDSRVFGAALAAFPLACGGAYLVLCHWLWGQTAGKILLRLRVEGRGGEPPTLAAATLRLLIVAASLLALGLPFLVAVARPDRRALHDLVCGTRVVRASREGGVILGRRDPAVAAS